MSSQSITLDGNKLKEISTRTRTSSVTAQALSVRERIRTFSDITRTRAQLIREGKKIVDTDYMAFWQELEAAGVGSIIYGRKNKPTRFSWHYSLKAVAKAMLEGGDVTAKALTLSERSEPTESSETIQSAAGPKGELLTQKVTFVLSPTRMIELHLPDNFSAQEAEAVASAIRTLAK